MMFAFRSSDCDMLIFAVLAGGPCPCPCPWRRSPPEWGCGADPRRTQRDPYNLIPANPWNPRIPTRPSYIPEYVPKKRKSRSPIRAGVRPPSRPRVGRAEPEAGVRVHGDSDMSGGSPVLAQPCSWRARGSFVALTQESTYFVTLYGISRIASASALYPVTSVN